MKRWKNGRLFKMVCRVMGDKAGGVMMEYVILAVLIAAAVVVAVAMFGKTLVGMFDVAATAATTREKTAKSRLEDTREGQDDMGEKAF
ncbi:MAG: hypothetical protein WCS01_13990, partial [bacterium]